MNLTSMNRRFSISNIPLAAALWDLLMVYVAYTVCRAVFLMLNWSLYADTLTWSHGFGLFGAGLLFDTPAILYTNAVVLVMFLVPLHWKESPVFYRVARWIYTVVNSVAVWRDAENLWRPVPEPLVSGSIGSIDHLGFLETLPACAETR